MTEVRVPLDLWTGDKTGSVIVWLYINGSEVKEGEILAELMVQKATFEIRAPADGTLRIEVEPDLAVEKGALLAVIER